MTRLLVDAAIVKSQLGGLRTYIRSLVGALHDRGDLELVVATSRPEDFAHVPQAELVAVPAATQGFVARAAWREARLAGMARRHHAELVLVPYPEMAVRRPAVPTVMVVHDVRAVVAPRYDSLVRRIRFLAGIGPACRAADHVVCVSEFARLSLDAVVALDQSKVSVIGEAASVSLSTEAPAERVDGRPFVLYVGSLLLHKNVDTLVRAFALDGIGADLVLAGPASDAQARHLALEVGRLGCGRRVRHVGWLDEPELARYYAGAAAVVIPSVHEGFGLPVVEAMQLGVPVIASDIPAFREVAAGHAVLVAQPLDPRSWRDAIAAIGDVDVAAIEQARRWAARLSWEDVGDQFVKLFAELSSGPVAR